MTEDATDLGYVFLVLGGDALKFAVKAFNLSASTSDPLNRFPLAYTFEEENLSKPTAKRLGFSVKVRDTFCNFHGMNNPELHDKAIRFGIAMFSRGTETDSFVMSSKSFDNLKQRHTSTGRGLRQEILAFMFAIYQKWPRETITRFDVGDNLFANEQEIDEWLQDLKEEGALTKGNPKINKRRGVTTGGYRIDPKNRRATEEEIASVLAESARHRPSDQPYLFLSYSTKDKVIAGKIKVELESSGFDVFLAHENIDPTDEWIDKIREALDQCDAFLALLTNKFRYSKWTDQEAGIALAKDKLIVPIKIARKNPHGFMSSIQAMDFNNDDPVGSCKQMSELLKDKLDLASK